MRQTIPLPCSRPGCSSELQIDPKHRDNLTAGGGWVCGEHEPAEACS